MGKRVTVKIRILDTSEARCCPKIRKFIGSVRVATQTPAGLFIFNFIGSTGLTGIVHEVHSIAPRLVEVIS